MSKHRRQHAFLDLLEHEPKVVAPCKHVAEGCGGCLLQEYEYGAQVRAKVKFLSDTYARPVTVVPAPSPLGYRNRMDFVAAFGKMGFRKRAMYAQVVDITDCLLLPPHAREAYAVARDILRASGLPEYNYIRHEGFLRYLVVRTSQRTKQVMLIITTKAPRDDAERAHMLRLCDEIHKQTGATSVHWTMNDTKGDISVGSLHHHVGEESILDEIGNKRFQILPSTFFQANTELATVLFDRAVTYAKGSVLDLCCGVGVISVLVSGNPAVSSVVGVELNAASVEMAKRNALLNNVSCEFICADMENFFDGSQRFDTVICDPARPGLGPRVCAQLLELAPSRIIYISCNPLTHKQDLVELSTAYDVDELQGFDLFPQTPHIEVLSVLTRRA